MGKKCPAEKQKSVAKPLISAPLLLSMAISSKTSACHNSKENMSFSSSTLLTLPLSAQLRSSLFLTTLKNSENSAEVMAVSTDSHFSHLAWTQQPRKQGGLGDMKIPLLADTNHDITNKYGVMVPGAGISYRGLFIIDKEHNVRQITINDLPVGRS